MAKTYLGESIPFFSVIVFSERCELKKVTIQISEALVIKRDHLYATVRNIWDNADDTINEEKVKMVYEKLEVLTHVNQTAKAAHTADIMILAKKYG